MILTLVQRTSLSRKIMKITSEYLLVFLLISAIEAALKDYYKILGVKKNASEKEIKKAFREKAKVLHPDKNQSPNAEQQFRDLAEGKYNKILILKCGFCLFVCPPLYLQNHWADFKAKHGFGTLLSPRERKTMFKNDRRKKYFR